MTGGELYERMNQLLADLETDRVAPEEFLGWAEADQQEYLSDLTEPQADLVLSHLAEAT